MWLLDCLLIRRVTRAGPVGWFVATTEDARKPAQFAVGAGHGAVNTTMMALLSAGEARSASYSLMVRPSGRLCEPAAVNTAKPMPYLALVTE